MTAKARSSRLWLERAVADALEDWIDIDERTGRLLPRPELDRATRARVRLVLLGLGLNDGKLRQARRRLFRMLQRSWKIGDLKYVKEALAQGPHRLLGKKFLESKRPAAAAAEPTTPRPGRAPI